MKQGIWEDDVPYYSCKYAFAEDQDRKGRDELYEPYTSYRDDLRDKYATEMSLTDELKQAMNFHKAYKYSDVVISRDFEGI